MKFGVRLPHFRHIAADVPRVGENVRAVARKADELGYHSVWVGDHMVIPGDPSSQYGSVWVEALTTLSFAAGCTDRVRVGTSVLITPYRHPLLAAKMLASLDVLSNGRLDVGLAVGWFEREFQTLGLDTFKMRGPVTDEYIDAMKMLWAGEESRFEGRFVQFDVDGLEFEPRPIQRPGLPIWIGGNSNRAAQRVAERGDVWQLMKLSTDDFAERAQELERQCDLAGRDIRTASIAIQQPMRITSEPGGPDEPLVGPAEHVIEQIKSFEQLGAVHISLDLFFDSEATEGIELPEMLEEMEKFAVEVTPHV